MTLQQECLDLPHGIQRDTDYNEKSCAPEELGCHVGNIQSTTEELWKDGNYH